MTCESVAKIAIDAAGDARLLYAVPVTPNNPRGIKVHHRGPGPHIDCPPRMQLECVSCHLAYAFCWVPRPEIDAHLAQCWTCPDCELVP